MVANGTFDQSVRIGDSNLISIVEEKRLQLSKSTEARKKTQLGQFLTPAGIAAFMVDLLPDGFGDCRLLDAGAGIGSLSAAFLSRWRSGRFHFQRVEVDAFELDSTLIPHLRQTLERYDRGDDFTFNIYCDDFIHSAVDSLSRPLFSSPLGTYTHAILNPPYKKINSNSAYRTALRRVGIETVNMYSAFVALVVALAAPGGHIVAIIPRSFCNGPYYRPFRDFILERASIRHIHLFESRNTAFKDDEVLQENIIIQLERGVPPGPVTVSTSTDGTYTDLATQEFPFERIVLPDDEAHFIHVPFSSKRQIVDLPAAINHRLADIGIEVSTGPVVDFRLRDFLRPMPDLDTVPLLYPGNFHGGGTVWPIEGAKKPNAIVHNSTTEKWLYPRGYYCVVRRFSSKEEIRRIVASVVEPSELGEAPLVGFENHLNVFHESHHGLPEHLARGLSVFLNTTIVDDHFRRFNGHTQVNATDLRSMMYPSRDALIDLGEWAMQQEELSQDLIDTKLGNLTE